MTPAAKNIALRLHRAGYDKRRACVIAWAEHGLNATDLISAAAEIGIEFKEAEKPRAKRNPKAFKQALEQLK